MAQTEGFVVKGQESKVYRLKKAIYGLKQADKSLKSLGFKQCLSDSGIYIHNIKSTITICILYVDDILFMGNDKPTINSIKKKFMEMWECCDLGKIKEYLCIQVNYNLDLGFLILDQKPYALQVVKQFGLENCKPTHTPLPAGYSPLKNEDQCKPTEHSYYQQIIGSLLHLALGTRPDIIYAVILMSQFSANPSQDHIQKALYIVRYIATTLDFKIGL
jgi:hypothetical protein